MAEISITKSCNPVILSKEKQTGYNTIYMMDGMLAGSGPACRAIINIATQVVLAIWAAWRIGSPPRITYRLGLSRRNALPNAKR